MNGEKRKFTNMCAHLGARRKAVVLLPALMDDFANFFLSYDNMSGWSKQRN